MFFLYHRLQRKSIETCPRLATTRKAQHPRRV
jgi:hypothetical protein